MIGFIALAGIIVRNSILLVDFSREAVLVHKMSVVDAVIHSCEARTRPIVITAFALIGGSLAILTDPIFQGMAVSLIFGGFISTVLTLLVVPLGCISAGKSLCAELEDVDGNMTTACADNPADCDIPKKSTSSSDDDKETLIEKIHEVLSTVFGIAITILGLVFAALKGLVVLIFNLVRNVFNKKSNDKPINSDEPVEPIATKKDTSAETEEKKSTSSDENLSVMSDTEPKKSDEQKTKPTKEKAKASTKAKAKSKSKKSTPSKKKIAELEQEVDTEEDKAAPKATSKADVKSEPKEQKKNKSTSRRGIRLKDDI